MNHFITCKDRWDTYQWELCHHGETTRQLFASLLPLGNEPDQDEIGHNTELESSYLLTALTTF